LGGLVLAATGGLVGAIGARLVGIKGVVGAMVTSVVVDGDVGDGAPGTVGPGEGGGVVDVTLSESRKHSEPQQVQQSHATSQSTPISAPRLQMLSGTDPES
jgi:hypothetical protein